MPRRVPYYQIEASTEGEVTVDREANTAYINLANRPANKAGSLYSYDVYNNEGLKFVVDVNEDGILVGIEVFGIDHLSPELKAKAIDITNEAFDAKRNSGD